MKVRTFESMEAYEAQAENEGFTAEVIDIVKDGKVIRFDAHTMDRKMVLPFLKDIKKSVEPYYNEFPILKGWIEGWIEEWKDCKDIASYDGSEDRKNGNWSYSFGFEKDEYYMYLFLNVLAEEEPQEGETDKQEEAEEAEEIEVETIITAGEAIEFNDLYFNNHYATIDYEDIKTIWKQGKTYIIENFDGLFFAFYSFTVYKKPVEVWQTWKPGTKVIFHYNEFDGNGEVKATITECNTGYSIAEGEGLKLWLDHDTAPQFTKA